MSLEDIVLSKSRGKSTEETADWAGGGGGGARAGSMGGMVGLASGCRDSPWGDETSPHSAVVLFV